MLILGLDAETNHFDPTIAKVTELGFILWDTELGLPVEIESYLVKEVGLEPLSAKIIEITGITDDMIEKYGKSPSFVISRFLMMYSKCDYMLAHNGNNFDHPLIKHFFSRYMSDGEKNLLSPKHWIDSLTDVDYPDICSHRSMTYLQGFYGIVNPFKHRAVTDIMTTITILHKNFKWDDILEISFSPTIRFIAEVDFHERDVAKEQKFKWDAAKKVWFRDVKKIFIDRKNLLDTFNFKWGATMVDGRCVERLHYRCVCKPCADKRYAEYAATRALPK